VSHLAIVIPTLGRPALLRRVLDRLERQTAAGSFEVLVAADAREDALAEVDAALAGRPYPARRLQGARPGASAARNAGWRAAAAPLVLFLDDDVLPEPALVEQHLAWHDRHPEEATGVLGHVRWADELEVSTFMRWLEDGIQFDYPNIDGIEAGWARFYTANASVKRALVERVGGFEEEAQPFGYEDLDLALRMHEAHGFTLLYNRAAVAEHLHHMELAEWKRRVARIAVSERRFVAMHPGFAPYFHDLFAAAAAAPPAKRSVARLGRVVPRRTPVVGRLVWGSVNGVFLQELAGPFLEAWEAQGP
jgi:GT2 family glycosyltransferase